MKSVDFSPGQDSVRAGFELPQFDWAYLGADQFDHGEADGAEDTADDAVATGMDDHFDHGPIPVLVDDGALVQFDPAVIQLDPRRTRRWQTLPPMWPSTVAM